MFPEIHHGDCVDLMESFETESFDLIIADPPYFNVSKEKWDQQWKDKEEYLNWMIDWTRLASTKLKDGGSMYVFGGIGPRNGFVFWNYVEQVSSFLSFGSYINWRRFRGKGYLGLHNNWPDSREDIAYFVKGKSPKVFNKQYMNEYGLSTASKKRFEKTGVGLSCTNIWFDIPEAQLNGGLNRTLKHHCEKPVALMDRIVLASSNKNDLVLDPFAGSGATGISCRNNNRQCVLIEKEKCYIELIFKRLNMKKMKEYKV